MLIQEKYKLNIVLLDNQGFKSIGALSRSLGQDGFGTRYAYPQDGVLPGDAAGNDVQALPVDLAANARSLGAHVIECKTYDDFVAARSVIPTPIAGYYGPIAAGPNGQYYLVNDQVLNQALTP